MFIFGVHIFFNRFTSNKWNNFWFLYNIRTYKIIIIIWPLNKIFKTPFYNQ